MKSSQSKSSREIYTRLLLQKEHGYPLWIPEPDGHLPEAYRGKGVGVGDVGILRNDGGFDYLFNACKPADDPINKGRVPEGFEPIICGDIREVETMHKRGSDIRSASVSRIEMSMGGAAESRFLLGGGGGFEFSCSREKGAILVLPDGGARYDALNISQFRSYAGRNAHAWYQFANIVHGREAVNGSLYLVTGCDKACSWGAASFFNPADTRSFSLKFLVGGVAEGNIKLGYSWKSASSADVRAYPDGESTHLVDSLRPNQCVFLRGFGISIRTNAFPQWVFGPTEVSQISGTSKDRLPCFDNSTPYSGVHWKRRKRVKSGSLSLYPETPRKRRKKSNPLGAPAPVSPPPSLARPLPPRQYYSSPNSTSPGWDTDYNEEQRRLGRMRTSNNTPSQEPRTLQGPAHRIPDNGTFSVPSFPPAGPYAGSDFATPFFAPTKFDATPNVSYGVLEDEFKLKDNASITSSVLESKQEGDDASSHGYNIPARGATLPLTINKHDVTTGGITHNYQQQQQPGASLNQPSGSGVTFGNNASLFGNTSSGNALLGSTSEIISNDRVRTEYSGTWSDVHSGMAFPSPAQSFAQRVPDEERKLNFKLWGPPALNDTTENQHQIISSDTMKLTRDSATSPPYSFPPTHDNQSLPSFQRYVGLPGRVQSSLHGLDQQVEGVASTSGAGTHGGPMEFQRSVLETGDDTSSVRTSSTAQSSPDLADLTGIARSFQPQTKLLNPCAMINEFILNTHPNVNVAITHSGEWSSALSQGDDSDDLLSDYKVIVHDGAYLVYL
ncbi:uncharacterized protein ARMOST_17314 [Armillaria ostoyae]|uniref:Uncharacterized protein n=1 Tax=Armillaria ostoyae TaxID=47428 RepID=A0A284RYL8_ARMOS|nr:uncharacterized protein ARMOST_17314 [Armillaria ostoyae]